MNALCALRVETSRTRGHVYKITAPMLPLDVRKRQFAVRIIPRWNALGHDTVQASSLQVFKRLLHRDLGDALYKFN